MSDDSNEPPEPPEVLGVRGSGLWRELHTELEFESKETSLVLEACRCLDVIDALATTVERDGLVVTGSRGQPVVHPGIAELRQWQASFGRLMSLVSLPEDEAAQDRFRHARAKAGAAARWQGGKLRAVK